MHGLSELRMCRKNSKVLETPALIGVVYIYIIFNTSKLTENLHLNLVTVQFFSVLDSKIYNYNIERLRTCALKDALI